MLRVIPIVSSLVLDCLNLSDIRVSASVCKPYYNVAWTYWQSRCVNIVDEPPSSKCRVYIVTSPQEEEKYELHQQYFPDLCYLLYISPSTRRLRIPGWIWSRVREGCCPRVKVLILTNVHNRPDYVRVRANTLPQLNHLTYECNLDVSVSGYACLDQVNIHGTCIGRQGHLMIHSDCSVTTMVINVTNYVRHHAKGTHIRINTAEALHLYLPHTGYGEICITSPQVMVWTGETHVTIERLVLDTPNIQMDSTALSIGSLYLQPDLCWKYRWHFQVYPLTSSIHQPDNKTCTIL